MPYRSHLQEELNSHFPTHLIDIRREMTKLGPFDRIWIDGQETRYGVYCELMETTLDRFNVAPKQLATDIAVRLVQAILHERSL